MRKYRFNKHFLYRLLNDSKKQYENSFMSKKDYIFLKTIIKELMYGKEQKNKGQLLDDMNIINIKFKRMKEELGTELIEQLLYLTDSIIKINRFYNLPSDYHKQDSQKLVTNVLKFYDQYSEEQFNYLNKFIHSPLSQLEILPNNIINQKKFTSQISILPFYDIDYIRFMQENRLYDEACLCHELRHALDIQHINKTILDLNALSEMNPIGMEFYYGMTRSKQNPKYKVGIKERLNGLKYIAYELNKYMNLLVAFSNKNIITKKTILETLKLKDKKELQQILIDLTDDSGYELISYFIGTLNGIKLCNIALDDKKTSIEIQKKTCSIMTGNRFIPKEMENILGKEFTIKEEDIKTYKEFLKKLR